MPGSGGHRHMPAAPKGWPSSARGMSAALAYIRQQLEDVGIVVDYVPHGRIYIVSGERQRGGAAGAEGDAGQG